MSKKEYIDKEQLFELVYPIGSIYLSAAAVNPADLFGIGTWEKIQNRFLLTSGSSYSLGATGGEATHKLTIDEMPSHDHIAAWGSGNTSEHDTKMNAATEDGFVTSTATYREAQWRTIFKTGGSKAHNNMPPYIVINAWKRVS